MQSSPEVAGADVDMSALSRVLPGPVYLIRRSVTVNVRQSYPIFTLGEE